MTEDNSVDIKQLNIVFAKFIGCVAITLFGIFMLVEGVQGDEWALMVSGGALLLLCFWFFLRTLPALATVSQKCRARKKEYKPLTKRQYFTQSVIGVTLFGAFMVGPVWWLTSVIEKTVWGVLGLSTLLALMFFLTRNKAIKTSQGNTVRGPAGEGVLLGTLLMLVLLPISFLVNPGAHSLTQYGMKVDKDIIPLELDSAVNELARSGARYVFYVGTTSATETPMQASQRACVMVQGKIEQEVWSCQDIDFDTQLPFGITPIAVINEGGQNFYIEFTRKYKERFPDYSEHLVLDEMSRFITSDVVADLKRKMNIVGISEG